ncbi:MAG TPA: hypothetical protein VNE39_16270 [Planctomycetota bacterium]|nr:hypothetical protein [Planctomycetota bacterium]
MASRGQSLTLTYIAWDTAANAGKTGDAGNHTLRWVKDGASAAPTNAPGELDATNAPGVYKLALTAAECACDVGVLCGKSSTASVVLIPATMTFELLPTTPPAANGGLATVDGSNRVAGVQGTLNTLDELAESLGAAADWTEAERRQVRKALGVDGEGAATSGEGNLDAALTRLEALLGLPVVAQTTVAGAGQDIVRFRGDTVPIAFDLGRDITGASLAFTVKRRATDPQTAALIAKTSAQGGGIEITNAAAGQFAVTLAAADTAALLPDGRRAAFLYDVEMTLDGAVETIFAGAFVLLPDVTTG